MLYRKKKAPSLLNGVGKEQVRATVIFSPAKTYPWLNLILKKGFAHVRVVIHQEHGINVLVDPRTAITTVHCFGGTDILIPEPGETHIRVNRMIEINKFRRAFGPLNCVEVVKGVLGIAKPLILTPHQLYKELRNG